MGKKYKIRLELFLGICLLIIPGCKSWGLYDQFNSTAIPVNVLALPGNREVTISWSSVLDASSYNIYWSLYPGVKKNAIKITDVTSPFVHSNLSNGTTYYYIVTSQNAAIEGDASVEAEATPYSLPMATGQISCFDGNGNLMSCTPGTVADGQDGQVKSGRGIHLGIPTLVGADYITKDYGTGLTWKTCTEGITSTSNPCDSGTGTATQYTWANAVQACVNLNAGSGYAGITQWRLPFVDEIETVINHSANAPATFTSGFPNTAIASSYYTSSDYIPTPSNVWIATFNGGLTSFSVNTTATYYAHCVTGPSLPSAFNMFTFNVFNGTITGNGTITDKRTNLVWQRCSMGFNNDDTCTDDGNALNNTGAWAASLTYCNNLSLVGKKWRLPNINELKSILDRTKSPPISSLFANTGPGSYWSSTTNFVGVGPYTQAWNVGFTDGQVYNNGAKSSSLYVRCVAN